MPAQNTSLAKVFFRTLSAFFTSPIAVGLALTWLFYQLVPQITWQKELIVRYCCSHPIEIVSMTLFFMGMAIYVRKLWALRGEHQSLALAQQLSPVSLSDNSIHSPTSDDHSPAQLQLSSFLSRFRSTYAATRIEQTLTYLKSQSSQHITPSELREHLKYLAELSLEKLNQSYQFAQTIIWAIPILGFLGTVMGITIAIANVTPEQLESSITDVTGGLAVAFDTTSLALSLSLVLVFCSFLIRQMEAKLVDYVETFGIEQLPSLLQIHEPLSLVSAQQQAAIDLLKQSDEMLAFHKQTWQASLIGIKERWEHSLQNQYHNLEQSLDHAGRNALTEQAQLLTILREETLAQLQAYREQTHEQMFLMQSAIATQTAELRAIAELYSGVHAQQHQLKVLQTSLDDNLKTIQQSDTFQETMETLSAAVQLLSTRARHAA